MTLYRPKNRPTYVYDFVFKGVRYRKNTLQTRLEDAQQVEANEKLRLRQRAGGLFPGPDEPYSFSEWAEVYYAYASSPQNPRRVTRPERIADILRVVLRFWGHPPDPESNVTHYEGEPYHSLTLTDPIRDPDWIVMFEDWMLARGVGAQTRNHYRSVMSRMYRTAMLPRYRKDTGITMNPFVGVERDRVYRRTVTITPDELRRWIEAASPHVRLALAIGSLAPKLRVASILGLKWGVNITRSSASSRSGNTSRRGSPVNRRSRRSRISSARFFDTRASNTPGRSTSSRFAGTDSTRFETAPRQPRSAPGCSTDAIAPASPFIPSATWRRPRWPDSTSRSTSARKPWGITTSR